MPTCATRDHQPHDRFPLWLLPSLAVAVHCHPPLPLPAAAVSCR